MSNKILEIGLNETFQDELEKASTSLTKLVEEKSISQQGKLHGIFGFFVKFTVNQMNMLNQKKFGLCNTDNAVRSCWILTKKSFVINAITLTCEFLESVNNRFYRHIPKRYSPDYREIL